MIPAIKMIAPDRECLLWESRALAIALLRRNLGAVAVLVLYAGKWKNPAAKLCDLAGRLAEIEAEVCQPALAGRN